MFPGREPKDGLRGQKRPETALTTVFKDRALENTNIDWTSEREAGEGEGAFPESKEESSEREIMGAEKKEFILKKRKA